MNIISPITEIITEAKRGNPFILIDDEARENEGDLVIPAEFVTPENINFMIQNCSGIICLTMPESKAREIGIKPMVKKNKSAFSTPFGISIEAKNGVTTGVSAFDRATTIKAALNKLEIVSPGHIFPLIANEMGVLAREGHTEASTDVCLEAGLSGLCALCEVVNPDGTMSKIKELSVFAKKHNIKIGTVASLVIYKRNGKKTLNFEEKNGIFKFKSKFRKVEYQVKLKGDLKEAVLCFEPSRLQNSITVKFEKDSKIGTLHYADIAEILKHFQIKKIKMQINKFFQKEKFADFGLEIYA